VNYDLQKTDATTTTMQFCDLMRSTYFDKYSCPTNREKCIIIITWKQVNRVYRQSSDNASFFVGSNGNNDPVTTKAHLRFKQLIETLVVVNVAPYAITAHSKFESSVLKTYAAIVFQTRFGRFLKRNDQLPTTLFFAL